MGTLVRLVSLVFLPYGFFFNGDCFLVLLWWWLLCGIDWPNLPVSAAFFVEMTAILFVAQLSKPKHNTGREVGVQAIATIATPMVLRFTGVSEIAMLKIWFPPLALVYIAYSVYRYGVAIDMNRLFDWTEGGASVLPMDGKAVEMTRFRGTKKAE